MTDVTHAPLNSLSLDPANVRTGKPAIGDLVASIPVKGVITPLVVREAAGGGYSVIEGSRRLAALKALARAGTVDKDFAVPVTVRDEADAEARETSLAANIQRMDLSPPDEAAAFARLNDAGHTVEDIMAHFGLTERRVRQRLAIGHLAKPVFKAFATGELNIAMAEAFTLTSDHKRQAKTFRDLKKAGQLAAHVIRNTLSEAALEEDSSFAEFVGREAYLAAGGVLTTDLFQDNTWWHDRALAMKLVDERLERLPDELAAEGWSFFEIDLKGKVDPWEWRRDEPEEDPALTDEQKARLDELLEWLAPFDDMTMWQVPRERQADVRAWTDEADRLSEKVFSAAQKATLGVLVSRRENEIILRKGVRRPSVKAKAGATAGAGGSAAQGSTPDTDDGPALSAAMLADLSGILGRAVQKSLLGKPQLARRLVLASLLLDHRSRGFEAPLALATTAFKPGAITPDWSFGAELDAAAGDVPPDDAETLAGLIARLEQLPAATDSRLWCALIARAVSLNLAHNQDRAADIARLADPDVSALWQPDGDWFKRLKIGQLLAAITETLGDARAQDLSKARKTQLVDVCVAEVAPLGWLPEPLRTPCYRGPGSDHYRTPEPVETVQAAE